MCVYVCAHYIYIYIVCVCVCVCVFVCVCVCVYSSMNIKKAARDIHHSRHAAVI
jgi:hypothetical protein